MNVARPLAARMPRIGQLPGGLLGGSPRLPPVILTRPARLAGPAIVYASPAYTAPVGSVNPTSTFELTEGPWPDGWVEIVFIRERPGALPQRIRGFVEESAFITPPARARAPEQRCEAPSCYLFSVPIINREITPADTAAALRVAGGTPLQVTSTITPAGWLEVLVEEPLGSGMRTRRYVRAAELSAPVATTPTTPPPGEAPPVQPEPPVQEGDHAEVPQERSVVSQVGQIVLLTAPAWGAVVVSYFLRSRS